uniref:DNA replication complex GINS protein PSF3 N-terminal domain-containing protein n=1 Tax=Trepomonas sp. PC1 TaxID=1076344 RepID=A0A146KF05_9EUKA|eukprot:JAP95303.1 hypothetical protein TPC1_11754 [Trepomonas sp. PC1]
MREYFDTEDLMNGFEPVPVQVKCSLPLLGKLDPRQTSSTLPKGAELEIPLWLLESTFAQNIFVMQLPPQLNEKAVNTMLLDPLEYKPQMKVSQNYFDTLVRMANCFSAKHDKTKKECLEAIRFAFQERQRGMQLRPTMCEAEMNVIRTRKELNDLFKTFQVCLLE